MRLYFSSLLLAITILATQPAMAADIPEPITRTLKGERLNDLAMWDLGGDGIFEILTTSVSGNAACYRADTLESIWSTTYMSETLTAPVIGDFLGTGAPVMAFASATGSVWFVWPGSGEVIGSLTSTNKYSLAPSVAGFSKENRDALVLADDSGQVIIYKLAANGTVQESAKISNTVPGSASFSIVGSIATPPSCSDINQDGIPEVVVTSESGVVQVITLSDPPVRSFIRLPQQTQATTLAGIGSVSSADIQQIVLGVSARLHIYQWNPQTNSINNVLETPAFGNTVGHIVLAPINGDASRDIIVSADNVVSARYTGADMNGKQVLLDVAPTQLTTINPSFSPAVPLISQQGQPGVVTIDGKGNIIAWQPLASGEVTQELGHLDLPVAFTPGGAFIPGSGFSLVSWNEKTSTLSVTPTKIALAADTPPVLTLGVNYSRNGQWGPLQANPWKAKLEKAAVALKTAQTSLAASPKDETSPLDAASIIRGIAPLDPVAQQFATSSGSSSSMLTIVSTALMFLVCAAAGWFFLKRRKQN